MRSGGYEVAIQHLEEAARGYEAQMEAIKQAQARFRAAADLHASAFGNLPQSAKLASQYQAFFSQVSGDMTKLWESLMSGALTLALTAIAYETAEKQNQEAIAQVSAPR